MYTKLNVLGLLLISVSATAGVGEWTSSGPYGGAVDVLAINPEAPAQMLAIANGSVVRSVDGAATWQLVNEPRLLSVTQPFAFDQDNDLIYAINASGQVLVSNDQGETWTPRASVAPAPSTVSGYRHQTLVDVPASNRVFLAFTLFESDPLITSTLLYLSTDQGVSFAPIGGGGGLPAGEPIRNVLPLDNSGVTLLVSTGEIEVNPVAPYRPSVYRSTDSGATWTPVLTLSGNTGGMPETRLHRDASGRILALVGSQVYLSTNNGVSFSLLTSTGGPVLTMQVVATDPGNANRFFVAGGVNGGGLSECTVSPPNYSCAAINSLRLSPNLSYTMANGLESLPGRIATIQPDGTGALWVGTEGLGVSRLSFVAGSWIAEQFNQGLSGVNIRGVLIHPNPSTIGGGQHRRIYAGYSDRFQETPGVYLTTNAGTTWSPNNNGLRLVAIRDLIIDPTTAGIGQPAGAVPLSASTLFATGRASQSIVVGISGQPYMGSSINRSTDGGTTWQAIGNGLPASTTIISGTPYLTPNIGTSRALTLDPRSCTSPPPGGPCTTGPLTRGYAGADGRQSTTVTPDPLLANKRLIEYRLFKSNNLSAATAASSVTWTDIGTPASGFPEGFFSDGGFQRVTPVQIVIDPTNSNTIYVSTFATVAPNPPNFFDPHNGVIKSIDGGATWFPANNGLPAYVGHINRKLDVLALAINPLNPQILYASTVDILAEGAGTAPSPLYKTVDGGANWLPSGTGIPARFDIRALAVDPGDPNIVYAAGYNLDVVTNPGGLYKSENAGVTWRSISIGLPATSATAIEIDPVNPSTVHVGTRVGLWSLTQVPDADGDGAPDATENGIQGGDGNGDGVQDSIQGDVGSTGVALRRPAKGLGGSNVTIDLFQSVSASNPNNPCTQNVDVSGQLALQFGRDYWNGTNLYYGYPDDVVQFEIVDCESAVVDITYHSENFNEYGWSFRFYGPGMPGDSSNVKWWDFNSRAVKLNSKTWRVTLDNDEFGSYRPPASNLIRFIGGPACFDDRLHVNGFEDAAPLTPPACN